MARRNLKPSDRRRMAVCTLKGRLTRSNTRFALGDFGFNIIAVTRACAARQDRDIRIHHCFQIGVLSDTNMTCCAVFVYMVFVLMIEFQRKALYNVRFKIRLGQYVTTRAVCSVWLLVLVMTVKTGRMSIRSVLEKSRCWCKAFRRRVCKRLERTPNPRLEFRHLGRRCVANRAIIKLRLIVIGGSREPGADKMSDGDIAPAFFR